MNSTSGILSTLRRLYHHLHNGGTWSDLDTATLSRAISTIEELSEGMCRFNCRTAKANWLAGYKRGAHADLTEAEEAYNEERKRNA